MIDRFDHLHIQPADFERSLAFYRDALGWTVVSTLGRRRPPAAARSSPAARSRWSSPSARQLPGGRRRGERRAVHLDIHDVDKRFEADPRGRPRRRPAGRRTSSGTRWFVVRDPDGNLVAFEEVNRHRG